MYRLVPTTVTCRLVIVVSVLLALFYVVSLGKGNWKQRSASMHVVVLELVLWQVSCAYSQRLYQWPDHSNIQLEVWEAALYAVLAISLTALFARQSS